MGLRRFPVTVFASWMRDERHTSAMRSSLTVCAREYIGGEGSEMAFRVILSRFMAFYQRSIVCGISGPYGTIRDDEREYVT